jgi:Family of unknown function (DUF5990)
VLQNPIGGTRYGLQKGKGPDYETVQGQLGSEHDLIFNFAIQVKEINGSLPTITGPFVQGLAGNRFIYIGIGSYAGQTGALWSGRVKVPLPEAAFENIQPDEGLSLWTCKIPGRNKDGKPVFATVKPFDGWFRHKQSDRAGA